MIIWYSYCPDISFTGWLIGDAFMLCALWEGKDTHGHSDGDYCELEMASRRHLSPPDPTSAGWRSRMSGAASAREERHLQGSRDGRRSWDGRR